MTFSFDLCWFHKPGLESPWEEWTLSTLTLTGMIINTSGVCWPGGQSFLRLLRWPAATPLWIRAGGKERIVPWCTRGDASALPRTRTGPDHQRPGSPASCDLCFERQRECVHLCEQRSLIRWFLPQMACSGCGWEWETQLGDRSSAAWAITAVIPGCTWAVNDIQELQSELEPQHSCGRLTTRPSTCLSLDS